MTPGLLSTRSPRGDRPPCVLGVSDGVWFQIVGGLILGLTLLFHVIINSHGGGVADETSASRTVGFILLYVMGSVVMVISILGACGAQKENRACLIVVSMVAVL